MRPTSIGAAVLAADQSAARGVSHWASVPHWSAEGMPHADGSRTLTLRHYGTPILYVDTAADGSFSTALGAMWWGSPTDCAGIARAFRALGIRQHIARGRLVAY